MRGRLTRILPFLLGGLLIVLLFGSLMAPSAVLAVRDIPIFHLPLRSAFAAAAGDGLPAWNPWIHGGQPILSNPNYAAFYPPTWLGLLVEPALALNVVLLLHAGLGFGGAWRLARRLGCEPSAAAFAAVAFTGGGAFVASASSLTPFCGLAWLPWILAWGDELFEAPGGRRLARLAGGLALQLLAGEPVIVLTTGLALVCLAGRRPLAALTRRWVVLAGAAIVAMSLAGIQLLPTAARLADSARGSGLQAAEVTTWSTPPARLIEWALPRFFGDPMRAGEGLYFGWRIHDRSFPYLISIYPGLLTLTLALAALVLWRVPRRGAWAALCLLGVVLALGRHNPLFAAAAEALPFVRLFRYPEKFLLLTTSGLAFAAALGWQHLLERRRRGDPGAVDFPLALAAVAAAVATALAALLLAKPALGEWFVRSHSLLPAAADKMAEAVRFLRQQAWTAVAVGGATGALLAAHRIRRLPEPALVVLTLGVLVADLGHHGRGLTPTVPLTRILSEGRLAGELAASGGRVFSDSGFGERIELAARTGRRGPVALWSAVDRLDPYIGNLWGLSYALNEDTDLMLTAWSRRALQSLRATWDRRAAARRLLGAWSVDRMVVTRPLREILAARLRGEPDDAAVALPNPDRLGRVRFAPRVVFHPDPETAAAAAHDDGFRLARREHWIDPEPGGRTGEAASAVDTRAWDIEEGFRTVRLGYRASAPTYLVVASTFDRGWRARVDGERVACYPTAAGQIGVVLPPGEHRVEIRYWDRWVTLGGLVTALALLGLAGLFVGDPRLRRAPAVPPPAAT